MPPPTLSCVGSDSEEEEGGTACDRTQPNELFVQSGKFGQNDFILSQSGAFKMADFQIRPEGGLTARTEGSDEAYSLSRVHNPDTVQLDVQSIDELEMLEQLGSGASATVCKARHVSSGALVAVKCVTILEKSKRAQVVSELRILMSHTSGSRWLVKLHNAFYGEAHLTSWEVHISIYISLLV